MVSVGAGVDDGVGNGVAEGTGVGSNVGTAVYVGTEIGPQAARRVPHRTTRIRRQNEDAFLKTVLRSLWQPRQVHLAGVFDDEIKAHRPLLIRR